MSIATSCQQLFENYAFDAHHSSELDPFIQWSYDQPEEFWSALFDSFNQLHDHKLHSILFQKYCIYHDCIVRHLGKKMVALKQLEEGKWREWTYDYIHRLVNYQVYRWKNHTFNEKVVQVAIVMPMGINLIISFLMAIRLGLRITILATDSPLLPEKRIRYFLDRIKVPVIITTPEISAQLKGKEAHWLIEYLEEKEEYKAEYDYDYAPDNICQLSVACYSQEENAIEQVMAQDMYLNALRDGFLTIGLRPETQWAYSPQCSLREQPFLLLMGLLHGSTMIFFSDHEIEENPILVESLPLDILGISSKMRDIWTKEKGFPKSKLKLWYHHLFDDDEKRWEAFIEKNKLQKAHTKRVLFDNAKASIPLSSISLTDSPRDPIWPSLGVKWNLYQLNQQELEAIYPYGVLKQHTQNPIISNFAISQLRDGWEVVGTIVPHRGGYTYPIHTIENIVSSIEFVEKAVLLHLSTSFSVLGYRFVLLVFTNPLFFEKLGEEELEWNSTVKRAIQENVGSVFLPEKIEFFPFLPKYDNKNVDRSWCSLQYTNGLLTRKKELRAYHLVGLLRKCIQE